MNKPPSPRFHRLIVWSVRAGLVLFWLAVFAATHMPVQHLPHSGVSNDKLQHLLAYAVLGGLLTSALATLRPWSWRLVLWAIAIAGAYGVLDELTQLLVGRTADPKDWIADVIGATLGSVMAGLGCEVVSRWTRKFQVPSAKRQGNPKIE